MNDFDRNNALAAPLDAFERGKGVWPSEAEREEALERAEKMVSLAIGQALYEFHSPSKENGLRKKDLKELVNDRRQFRRELIARL